MGQAKMQPSGTSPSPSWKEVPKENCLTNNWPTPRENHQFFFSHHEQSGVVREAIYLWGGALDACGSGSGHAFWQLNPSSHKWEQLPTQGFFSGDAGAKDFSHLLAITLLQISKPPVRIGNVFSKEWNLDYDNGFR
jgi:hypothetical protein